VLKKSVLDFFKASWQKRGFAKMLKSLKRKDRFNDLARRPGAHSLFFNRLLWAFCRAPILFRKKQLYAKIMPDIFFP
jgi:hypothetical protein